ncbi:MAG: energy transducer TonB, partial [Magnetospirillum sp.]
MTRGILGTILWSCLAACIGVGLFFVKHEVKDQERHLNALTAEIQRNQETIHILRAEWSYLNDPARLRALSEKHLGMHPVLPAQVATLD